MPRYKRPHYPFPQLIADISRQFGISESTVRLVLKAFAIIVAREVAKGHQISYPRLGCFYLKHQRVHYSFKNRGHSKDETYITTTPHFTTAPEFKAIVQTLANVKMAYGHRSAEAQKNYTFDITPYMDEEDSTTATPSSSPSE